MASVVASLLALAALHGRLGGRNEVNSESA
jgi:hypothetical protein